MSRRSSLSATAISVGALMLGGTVLAAPATSVGAPPAIPALAAPQCPEAFPAAGLENGQPVTGETVSAGSSPDGFTGEVLGVLDDGIGPDLDMILVRLSSPEIDRVGGIWAGMSGSPVYAADGRLIGAVSYGLAWGASPVAGVTPYAEMQSHLGTAPAVRVAVPRPAARRIAGATEVGVAQAEQGLRQLPMDTATVGVRASRLDAAQRHMRTVKRLYAAGTTAAPTPGAEALVPGGTLGATLASGFITLGGFGTVTAVCGDRVVGFGHPAIFAGEATYAMHPADTVYIQEDPLGVPFKVANFAPPVGTITDDRMAGIAGTVGALPDTVPLASTASYRGRTRSATTNVSHRPTLADATYLQLLGLHDRLYDGRPGGSASQSWTITGTAPDGAPWRLTRGNRYTASSDLTWYLPGEVASDVWSLSGLPGVEIDGVTTRTDTGSDTGTWTLRQVQRRVRGVWTTIDRSKRLQVRAGRTLVLRVLLRAGSEVTTRRVKVEIPRKAARAEGMLVLTGGLASQEEGFGGGGSATDLDTLLEELRDRTRSDQVQGRLMLTKPRATFEETVRSAPADKVVTGRKRLKLMVAAR